LVRDWLMPMVWEDAVAPADSRTYLAVDRWLPVEPTSIKVADR
jgi:hypothetical protein